MLTNIKNTVKTKKGQIIFICGITGIVLIFLSSLFSKQDKSDSKKTTVQKAKTVTEQYVEQTEKKLEETISKMLGNTETDVMITLESGVEYIYADEGKSDSDVTHNKTGEETTQTQQTDSKENQYTIIKNEDGSESALMVTEVMPVIRGVVVVCDCNDNQTLKEAVKDAVVTALNVSTKRVCITGRLKEEIS